MNLELKRDDQPSVFYTKKRALGDPYKVQHNKYRVVKARKSHSGARTS